MAEKKAVGHAYNIDFLNVVFAASSIFLLLTTVWMVWDDFDREWKNTQRRFVQLETEVTQANLERATRGVDQKKMADLQARLATAERVSHDGSSAIAVTAAGRASIGTSASTE